MDRAKWIILKGEIGLASEDLFRLGAYVGLLTNFKALLEQKRTYLGNILTRWRRQRTGAVDSTTHSVVFRIRTQRLVLKEVYDIDVVFTDEGGQLILIP